MKKYCRILHEWFIN